MTFKKSRNILAKRIRKATNCSFCLSFKIAKAMINHDWDKLQSYGVEIRSVNYYGEENFDYYYNNINLYHV